MRGKTSTLILLLALLPATALAGCLGDQEPPEDPVVAPTEDPDPYVPTMGGNKRASALTANDTVEAPEWQVGDWFGHHVYLQTGPAEGRHYNTVVVDQTDDGWILAPDDAEAAKEEATWDLPVAGTVGKDLATTAYGAAWDLFRFPLEDGKTWEGSVEARDLQEYQLHRFDASFQATFDPAIDVNGQPLAGFRITGTTSEGDVVVDASYIPAIRWYGHITVFEVRTEDEADFFLKTTSMGYGTGWTGTYHQATGDLATDHFGGFVAFAPTAIGPSAPETFTVPDVDVLFGMVFAYAWNGAGDVVLVDPEGTVHENRAAHAGADMEGEVTLWMVDDAAIAGDWAIASIGGGPVWVAGAYLFALTMEEGTL